MIIICLLPLEGILILGVIRSKPKESIWPITTCGGEHQWARVHKVKKKKNKETAWNMEKRVWVTQSHFVEVLKLIEWEGGSHFYKTNQSSTRSKSKAILNYFCQPELFKFHTQMSKVLFELHLPDFLQLRTELLLHIY